MKHLVIIAHHNRESFSHAIAGVVQDTLRAQGHEVVVRDLNALGFNPVLTSADAAALRAGPRANGGQHGWVVDQRAPGGAGLQVLRDRRLAGGGERCERRERGECGQWDAGHECRTPGAGARAGARRGRGG